MGFGDKIKEKIDNAKEDISDVRDVPTVAKRFGKKLREKRNERLVEKKSKELHEHYQNNRNEQVTDNTEKTPVVVTNTGSMMNVGDFER